MDKIHLTKMDIVLDGNKTEYQTGDQISGLLKIAIKGFLSLKDINIGLVCMAEVNWTENPGSRYHRDPSHVYHDKQKIFGFCYQMPEQYSDQCLSGGEHVIPFKFKLPEEGIPSSFTSSHGSVTYYVEINIPESEELHTMGKKIVVNAPFRQNLNFSVGGSIEKDLGVWSWGSGKITLYASVEKKAFIPGEMIELHCSVENESNVDVTPRATLYQTQIYMCKERHKSEEVTITDAIVGTNVEKETNNKETILISIPKDATLSLKTSIISVKYFIHVTLDIPHAIDLHLNLPIVVTNQSVLKPN